MSSAQASCSECGARNAADAERCSLCGWVLGEPGSALQSSAGSEEAYVGASSASKPVFCNGCAWKNPAGARFCSQCGAPLQQIASAPRPPRRSPEGSANRAERPGIAARQAFLIVGAAMALIASLFLVTTASRRAAPPTEAVAPASSTIEPAPASGALAEQLAVLDGEMQSGSAETRIAVQREKAFLLMQAGRGDLAAVEYQQLAQRTGSTDDWRIAGDLFYDWMANTEDVNVRAQIAASAVEAYENVLEQEPDNLGVRTDLATAYLNTGSPMKGVTAIKQVLEADSMHLDANFNYGLMLMRIGRNDQATAQFERVLALADSSSEHFSRASDALRMLQSQDSL